MKKHFATEHDYPPNGGSVSTLHRLGLVKGLIHARRLQLTAAVLLRGSGVHK